jgi:hypothetical protein
MCGRSKLYRQHILALRVVITQHILLYCLIRLASNLNACQEKTCIATYQYRHTNGNLNNNAQQECHLKLNKTLFLAQPQSTMAEHAMHPSRGELLGKYSISYKNEHFSACWRYYQ